MSLSFYMAFVEFKLVEVTQERNMLFLKILCILTIVENLSCSIFYQFRKTDCSSSGKSVNISFCYPKTYAKKQLFTFNIKLVTSRKLDKSETNYSLFKENSMGDFERILSLEKIKFCQVFRMTEHQGLLKIIVNELKRTDLGKIINACNKTLTFIAVNVSLSESPSMHLFPSANYKTVIDIFDGFDENIFHTTILARIYRK